MSYKEKLREIGKEGKEFTKVLLDETRVFGQMHDLALEDKVLDKKTKELIALAIGVSVRCEPCIIAHVSALVGLGATRDEIAETLGVCFFMGGGPAKMYGAKALACYDELVAEK